MTAVVQPSGTVTLVFTDIEGSTRLLDELGVDGYRAALAEHRRVVRDACARQHGYEVDYEGDAFFYAFASAQAAVSAVSEAMSGLEGGPIRIRVGIHTGEPALDPPKYVGLDVHRAARIMSSAHGGQVVLSPATVSLLEPDSVQLRDLGEHRLKDLSAPMRLHQLQVDGFRTEFPPLKTLYRSNLPVPATPFIGRKRELAEIAALLTHADVRLVTLTGPGGTGKTRLALQAAAETADHHPDGITWIPLASLRDPSRALSSIADALGVRSEPGLTLAGTLASGLEGRRPLLVIDNAEHLLPELASALAEFRRAVPTARLLLTSRERLQLDGEQVYAVPGLDGSEGVDLFLERSRALGAALEETPAVAQLCRRLDQLPLALELAAARAPLFGPDQLLERLDQRLDLLKGGRDADPRQHTLRATIAWSHDLLDDTEQRLFRHLAVFVGGCTYGAAEQVAGADPDTLQSLIDKSLVRPRYTDDGPRYWMLETIREYAMERLADAGELEELERRHFDFYDRLVREADEALMGPAQRRWLATLDDESANWRAALQRELENTDRVAPMAAGLSVYWWFRGRAGEGLPLLLALEDRGISNAAVRARTLRGAVDLANQLDLRDVEQRCLEDALSLSAELGDADGVAQTCANYVWWAVCLGDSATATVWANRALEAAEHIEATWLRGYVLCAASTAAGERGDFGEARQLAEKALRLLRASANARFVAVALGSLGWLAIMAGNYEAAHELHTEELALADPDDPEHIATVESNLGLVDLMLDRPVPSAVHFRASLSVAPPGNRRIVAEAMLGIAGLAAATSPEAAVRLWAASAALHERSGAPLGAVLERIEESKLAPIRTALDRDEFDRIWADGRSLATPAAIDLATDEAARLARAT